MNEPKPTLKEDAAEYLRIQEEWIARLPEKVQEPMRKMIERSFYAGSVSIDSVLCRLNVKDIEDACVRHPDNAKVLLNGMKMNLDLQNGTNYREKTPMISLKDWGLMIVHTGLCAIAVAEEDE